MTSFQRGDRVEIVKGTFSKEIENMLIGKIGTVVEIAQGNTVYWEVHAQFEGTQRPGGYFGFHAYELRKVS